MKPATWLATCVLALTVCPVLLTASGPIGVFALVDKVAFEPNSGKPERIRISGVFIAAEETPDNSTVYSAAQRGYLYLALPKSDEELARREWEDLKSVAGTRQDFSGPALEQRVVELGWTVAHRVGPVGAAQRGQYAGDTVARCIGDEYDLATCQPLDRGDAAHRLPTIADWFAFQRVDFLAERIPTVDAKV